jgi:hypothetical protein
MKTDQSGLRTDKIDQSGFSSDKTDQSDFRTSFNEPIRFFCYENECKRRLLFSKTIVYDYGNGQSQSPSHF